MNKIKKLLTMGLAAAAAVSAMSIGAFAAELPEYSDSNFISRSDSSTAPMNFVCEFDGENAVYSPYTMELEENYTIYATYKSYDTDIAMTVEFISQIDNSVLYSTEINAVKENSQTMEIPLGTLPYGERFYVKATSESKGKAVYKPMYFYKKAEDITPVFSDVPAENQNLCIAVNSLFEKGILNGYEDETFRPENTITRSEIAKILSIAGGNSDSETEYTDVGKEHWAYDFITKSKFFNGYEDGSFKPDGTITNAEAITTAVRLAGLEDMALNSESKYPYNYISIAGVYGLTEGCGEMISDTEASRGNAAILIDNALKYKEK